MQSKPQRESLYNSPVSMPTNSSKIAPHGLRASREAGSAIVMKLESQRQSVLGAFLMKVRGKPLQVTSQAPQTGGDKNEYLDRTTIPCGHIPAGWRPPTQ
jgi:hypothetical protein